MYETYKFKKNLNLQTFSSGPTKKPDEWSIRKLNTKFLEDITDLMM